MKYLFLCIMFLAAAATGCKQRYDAPVHSPATGYLVVDGVVNSGQDSTVLTLTRTTKFDNRDIVYETGAAVSVQGQDSSEYFLAENTSGVYTAVNLNLNSGIQYRLRITAANGEQYVSDFVPVKNDPPIDSLSWKRENGGVQFYINTHDPQNNTRYYQWVYDETWEIQSSFLTNLKYQVVSNFGGDIYSVVYRDSVTFSFDPNIITCWQFNNPTDIFIGTTAKLSKDQIQLPVAYIPPASIKLSVLYSMRIRQYAWPEAGYQFLENMKKNTESTGTIFDPQPSELKGNIHSVTDASEPVIGYFNVCPVQEKRIFIRTSDVPAWNYNPNCMQIVLPNNSDSILQKGLGLEPTTVSVLSPFGGIASFNAAPPECVDCTLRGTNKKPSYWP